MVKLNEMTDPLLQLENRENINKYKTAGKIAMNVLDILIKNVVPGSSISYLCDTGDNLISSELDKVYTDITNKGIAFPTCISIDNIAGCYSPKDKNKIINDGDLVKIELGVHIDGFPALIAYTVLSANNYSVIDSKKVNVLKATMDASKQIIKVLKSGKMASEVVKILDRCAKKYNCAVPTTSNEHNSRCPGIISYEISRNVLDDFNEEDDEYIHRFIMNKPSDSFEYGFRDNEFENLEVYAIDIVMCSGEGKLTASADEDSCNIYRRKIGKRVNLKLNSSKNTLSKFREDGFPTNTKNIQDSRFLLGLKECVNKGLVYNYPVMREKTGEYVARLKFTVIIEKEPVLITGRSLEEQLKKVENITI